MGSEYYSHLASYTVRQRDKTLVNPGIQVVLSQRDPLPCPTFREVPEESASEPASRYAAVSRRQHSRQERTIEDGAEDRLTRRGLVAAKEVELYAIDRGLYDASIKCRHCYAQSWPEERGKDEKVGFWRCWDNGKNGWPRPINRSSSKMCIQCLMALKRTASFRRGKSIACSMKWRMSSSTANPQREELSEAWNFLKISVGHTTIRIQGSVHHLMGPLMPERWYEAEIRSDLYPRRHAGSGRCSPAVASSTITLGVITASASPTQSVFDVVGRTFTAEPTGFSIAGTSLTPAGSAVTISGTPISLAPSDTLVIGSNTIPLPTQSVFNVDG
nr:hypothetical protein [Cladonia uncialis subsp. uncialis]